MKWPHRDRLWSIHQNQVNLTTVMFTRIEIAKEMCCLITIGDWNIDTRYSSSLGRALDKYYGVNLRRTSGS